MLLRRIKLWIDWPYTLVVIIINKVDNFRIYISGNIIMLTPVIISVGIRTAIKTCL
jgi:hypothetical protein